MTLAADAKTLRQVQERPAEDDAHRPSDCERIEIALSNAMQDVGITGIGDVTWEELCKATCKRMKEQFPQLMPHGKPEARKDCKCQS